MDSLRVRFPSTGVLILLVTIALFLVLASPAPAAILPPAASDAVPPPPPASPGELMAIDVPLSALPVLQDLHVRHQDEPRDGLIRAAASAAQLEQLRQAGISFTEIAKVAIFSKGGEQLAEAYCNGANYTDYTIPYWYSYNYVYSPIWLNCAGATTVRWIDVHDVLKNVYSQAGKGLTEVGVVVGRNSPAWGYVTLETFDYCTPSGPVLDALGGYDRWVFNVDSTYGTSIFTGVTVNQRYDLALTDYCNRTPIGSVDYWEIYAYYIAPTPTQTRTPTATPRPSCQLSGSVFNGPLGDETLPIANVPVRLYCSNNSADLGNQIAVTTTNSSGWYGLPVSQVCEFYNIVESDLSGYTSVGASSVGGTVMNANWIQYTYPVCGVRKVLTSNKFWDRRRLTATPTRTNTRPTGPTVTHTRTPTRPSGPTWTPTRTPTRPAGPTVTHSRTPTRTGGPGLDLKKRLLSSNPAVVSQTVRFAIDIYNLGPSPVTTLFLNDVYSTTYLSFLGSDVPPTDATDDGSIEWNDIIPAVGPIPPGGMVSVMVAFHANKPTGQLSTRNCAAASYALPGVIIMGYGCEDVSIIPAPPSADVDKTLLSPPIVCVSDTVVFGVAYTNTGPSAWTSAAVTDTYNTGQLSLTWPPLPDTSSILANPVFVPPFPVGASDFFTLAFHADAPANPANNRFSLAPSSFGIDGPADTSTASVIIEAPGPCAGNAVVNPGFEDPMGPPWDLGGNLPPTVVSGVRHGGANSLRMGGMSMVQSRGFASTAAQVIFIPSNVAHAEMSFWYHMETSDVPPFDQFVCGFVSPPMMTVVNNVPLSSTPGWVKVTASLDAYRGKAVTLAWAVVQDTSLVTTVWLDDIQVCFSACGPLNGGNTPGGGPFCWKQHELPDYAPSGVPDFSQVQADWTYQLTRAAPWSFDAPVAIANSLWWFDSKFERAATAPPAISDNYNLVTAYGQWDDHDARNVVPLVNDLARRMSTNDGQAGTLPVDAVDGIRNYLTTKGLSDRYTVTYKDQPRWDWVKSEVKRSEDVVLLVGFWEQQPEGWKRLGGHYVTAAGVSCFGDSIAISDPWMDNAETGGPGEIAGTPIPHRHPSEPPDVLHNDARFVSHDLYSILSTNTPGGGWGLARYVQDFNAIGNFMGVNVPMGLIPYQAERYYNGEISAVVERAIAVSPAESTVTIRVDPATAQTTEQGIVSVELVVDAISQQADSISVYMDFDPQVLTIVNTSGNPVSSVVAGPDFPTPWFMNTVNNAAGHIDLIVPLPGGRTLSGRMVLATLLFKAKTATPAYGTPLSFVFEGERLTDILSGGNSVLGQTAGGFIAVSQGRVLNGRVTLQGRPNAPNASWVTPVLLTLHEPGSVMPSASMVITTNQNGQFTVPGLPTGVFDIKVKGLHTLRNALPGANLGEGETSLDFGMLLEGDANNDNMVSAADLSIYSAAFGKNRGEAGFDARADFNNDGKIDPADLNLLQINFGMHGDIVLGGGAPAEEMDVSALWSASTVALDDAGLASLVNLSLQPISSTLSVGQMFTLTVRVEAGAQPVDAVEIHIALPSGITVVSPDGTPADSIQGSGALPMEVINHVDNAAGLIDYAAAYPGTGPSGTFTLATIRLRAGQPLDNWPVRFLLIPGRMTDVMFGEQSVLGSLGASWITVSGRSLWLPVILSNWR